jgi:cytochrome c553
MKIHWKTVGLTLVTLALLGFIAASAWIGFGLYNVSARLGHFPGMSWVFHTTYRNAVDLWSDETRPVPDTLDDPGMIELGAKHYESACRVCHAAPGAIRTATMKAMLPQPPHIEEAVQRWTPIQLRWIVHEGVKMSAMPGWPVSREEEPWSVVAFLMAVQDGMTPEEYQDMTRLRRAEPRAFALCTSCHGSSGVSDNPYIPRLDILSEQYVAASLRSYRDGSRQSGIMQHAATEVPEEVLSRAAGHYGRISPPKDAQGSDMGDEAHAGREIAFAAPGGNDEIPACRACHGPWDEDLDTLFPSIAGQNEPYIATQLRLWREQLRGGGVAAQLMHQASRNLTDADIDALAAYYAALPPAKLNAVTDPDR